MALKPVNKRNGLDSRQALWEIIREMRTITLRGLRNETVLSMDTVREYVLGLEKAGFLQRLPREEGPWAPNTWELIKDVGIEAPRVRKDGTLVTQGDGRRNMWEAMRILRTFTPRELAVAASLPECPVKESTALDYAKHLCKAGYLKQNGKAYRFLPAAYTGPMAPQIQRTKLVWDPNLKVVRWRSDGEVANDK
ncbi:MAG: hypothetical protein AB7U29_15560 [Desulfobulbus sp.]